MKNSLLSQYTKDEILNAIKSECDYCAQRRLASFCEMERLKQDEKKSAENLKRVERLKQAYTEAYNEAIEKYGSVDNIPVGKKITLAVLQGEFVSALNED